MAVKKGLKVEYPTNGYINGMYIPYIYFPSMLWMLEEIVEGDNTPEVTSDLIRTMLSRLEYYYIKLDYEMGEAENSVLDECIETKGWTKKGEEWN